MNQQEMKIFDDRIKGNVFISADIAVSSSMTESAAEILLNSENEKQHHFLDLYERICNYAVLHGEDFQSLFRTDTYSYMSCFVRDTHSFEAEFSKEEILSPLFNHGKSETVEYVLSFPDKAL